MDRAIELLEQEPCEDAVSRQAVLKTLDDMDNVLDEDRTVENYKELLKECYEVLPFVNLMPCEDAISRRAVLDLAKKGVLVSNGNYESVCKAINELPSVNPQEPVLDKIRAEIEAAMYIDKEIKLCKNANASGLEVALQIIDKHNAESEEE